MQNRQRFVLDPYIVRAVGSVSAIDVAQAVWDLYPDLVVGEASEEAPLIEAWLVKLRKRPGLALSTGGRNSDRGLYTCALLSTMGIQAPKARMARTQLAWSILDSELGRRNIGDAPELDSQRILRDRKEQRPLPFEPTEQKELERGIRWTDAQRGSSAFYDGVLVCHVVLRQGSTQWKAKWLNGMVWEPAEQPPRKSNQDSKLFASREDAKLAVQMTLT